MSDDGLTYDFALRQGVKFHNGDAFTAEDVQFSFERFKGVNDLFPSEFEALDDGVKILEVGLNVPRRRVLYLRQLQSRPRGFGAVTWSSRTQTSGSSEDWRAPEPRAGERQPIGGFIAVPAPLESWVIGRLHYPVVHQR